MPTDLFNSYRSSKSSSSRLLPGERPLVSLTSLSLLSLELLRRLPLRRRLLRDCDLLGVGEWYDAGEKASMSSALPLLICRPLPVPLPVPPPAPAPAS